MAETHGAFDERDRPRHSEGFAAERWPDPCSRPPPNPRAERQKLLVRTIEGEIIPRLLLAHRAYAVRTPRTDAPSSRAPALAREDAVQLAAILIGHSASQARTFVEALVADGVPIEAIFLDLLAPAARELGELWKADHCDFTDVTLGLSRLHQLVRSLGDAFEREGEPSDQPGGRALMATMPGDQHIFGIILVEEFLRRDGWTVWSLMPRLESEVIEAVENESFALIGFSLGSEVLLDGLASLIRSVRRTSRNPHIQVLVGGPVFLDQPGRVAEVGADATACDGREAVQRTRHLMRAHAARA